MTGRTRMEGYRIHEWGGDLVWEEIPEPTPGAGEVLVEIEACGIGLTVLNCIAGMLADERASLPRVPGHEMAGIVSSAGEGIDDRLLGRRVVGYFYLFCGECPACRAGWEQRCSNLAGWVGVHRDGGYAPWMVLPARNVVPVPDGLDPVDATVIPDAVATPVHVAARADIGPTDRVAVVGAGGGVGIHMVQMAQLRGAWVAGLDVQDQKLETIEELGAVPVRSNDLTHLDTAIFDGEPPTVVVDFVGTEASMRWGKGALGIGGRMVALATFPGVSVPVSPRELVFSELALLGSRYATRDQVGQAADLVARGRIKPVIGRVAHPKEVPSVHDSLRNGSLLGRGAVDWRAR